ncbi:protein kinase-like domain, Phloem protein 2-like protein [Artemisia annua]|uniref:Protein kinase-like domain, Phloem protein 2-like protein n=1 Tax=Artemisia annua TaxID=35608 RepID=A0A2U1NM63_ARTAN|nr:protein kinase-like domain, Phloem protein 2-like protein [Artemisia annua]
MDPIYLATGFLKVESDTYSFGVLLFLTLIWMPALFGKSLLILITRDQISGCSFHMIKEIANKCISYNIDDRPTMDMIIKTIEEVLDIHLRNPNYDYKDYEEFQVDVYSFGVVMFEILSGLMASERTSFNNEKGYLIKQVHRYYNDEELDKLIDPNIRDQIDGRSLHNFAETAYRCLSYNIKKGPPMSRIIKRIEELKHCTFNKMFRSFDKQNGLCSYWQNHGATHCTTTIRSDQYQKLEDLLIPLQEINLATDELSKNTRIGSGGFGICLRAAKGSNTFTLVWGRQQGYTQVCQEWYKTLLDENMDVNICDFGFSTPDSANNQQQSKLYTNAASTNYYIDPIYHKSGILETDAYSFGMVIFEMLSEMRSWYQRRFGHDKPQL